MSELAAVPPRISIVTPSFQQAPYLEECLRSVREQDAVEVEHIVVDGGSTDGSRAIIERYADKLSWWCCEKDRGQSDAINKGLARATGDIFGWLNSDDALLPGALQRVGEAFATDPSLLVYGGRILHRSVQGDRIFDALNDARDEQRLFRDPVVNQPATFYRMSAVKGIGVDPALRYVMDLELWWRILFQHGTRHLRFEPIELAAFRLHPGSKTVSSHAGFLDEIAGLLHGMCLMIGSADLARILAMGHAIKPGLRGVPVGEAHRERVRGMTAHFLLKWHGSIHRREEFLMMKALKGALVEDAVVRSLDQGLLDRWNTLDDQLTSPGWLAFRLRRKWKSFAR